MSFNTRLAAVFFAVFSLAFASGVQAKGPQSGNRGSAPSHEAGNSNGLGSNSWSNPPGWGKASESKGWDEWTSPPGWNNNAVGQQHGWDSSVTPGVPPDLGKR